MVRKTYKKHDIEIPEPNDPTKTISKNNFLAEDTHAEDGMLGFTIVPLDVNSGVITPKDTYVQVTPENDEDDILQFIDIGPDPDINVGDILILRKGGTAILNMESNASGGSSQLLPLELQGGENRFLIDGTPVVFLREESFFREITSYVSFETMFIPLGNESDPPTQIGTFFTKYMPKNAALLGVYQECTVAPSGTPITLDIKVNGNTIFSTKPTIVQTANTGENGVLLASPTGVSKGAKLEFGIDALDSGNTAAGIKLNVFFFYVQEVITP